MIEHPETAMLNCTEDDTNSQDQQYFCVFTMETDDLDKRNFYIGLVDFMRPIVCFLIPGCIIFVCYYKVTRLVRAKLMSKHPPNEKMTRRVTKLALAVIVTFAVCWLPNHAVSMYSAFGMWGFYPFNTTFYYYANSVTICIAYANSCINPFLYAFSSAKFRRVVKEMHCNAPPPNSPPVSHHFFMNNTQQVTSETRLQGWKRKLSIGG